MAKKEKNNSAKKSIYNSWWFIILVFVMLPLCFRFLIYSPYHIPSGSMKPTLKVGDFIFVSKTSYGYGAYSLPFGWWPYQDREEGEIWGKLQHVEPKRGDIVVFRPMGYREDYIKRVIGLPNDTIQVKNGAVYLNEEQVPRETLGEEPIKHGGKEKTATVYKETLPNGVSYKTYDIIPDGDGDNTMEYIVPAGHYFMMGDNRDDSTDSRFQTISYIPAENLVGRADIIFISSKQPLWKVWTWFTSIRLERFLKLL